MSFNFNSQISKRTDKSEYTIQITTDNYEQFLFMQDMAHECIDGKHKNDDADKHDGLIHCYGSTQPPNSTLSTTYDIPLFTTIAQIDATESIGLKEWSEPLYKCPKCNDGNIRRNNKIELASLPPQYLYKCDKCGCEEYKNR